MLMALNKYWRAHPPTHLLMAAYVGFKPPVDPETHVNNPVEIEALMSIFRVTPPPPPKADSNGR